MRVDDLRRPWGQKRPEWELQLLVPSSPLQLSPYQLFRPLETLANTHTWKQSIHKKGVYIQLLLTFSPWSWQRTPWLVLKLMKHVLKPVRLLRSRGKRGPESSRSYIYKAREKALYNRPLGNLHPCQHSMSVLMPKNFGRYKLRFWVATGDGPSVFSTNQLSLGHWLSS
jgi:hypothetical protein